jgi:glycosyltransferase involved in cell wall biosynthesis
MKYAICSEFAYPFSKGGVEKRYHDLALKLVEKGHSVVWFTTKTWEGNNNIIKSNIEYISICQNSTYKTKNGKRNLLQPLRFGFSSIKIFLYRNRFEKIDISQYPFFHAFPLYLICRILNKKSILSVYELWGKHWFSYRNFIIGLFGIIIETLQIFFAKKVLIISDQGYKKINNRFLKKTVLIPNWINYEKVSSCESKYKEYDLCYFGRLVKHKNVDKVLETVAYAKNNNVFLKTIIIGDGDQKNNLINLASELNINDRVTFTGFIENHSELLQKASLAKLFLMLSDKEGGGSIVSIEANAIGLPLICNNSKYGIDHSLVVEGFNGYRVESNDVDKIFDKIQTFYKSSDYLKINLYNNCKNFAKKYDIEIATQKYITY